MKDVMRITVGFNPMLDDDGIISEKSDDDLMDINENVEILDLAMAGKFDNRRCIRKQGGVDFSQSQSIEVNSVEPQKQSQSPNKKRGNYEGVMIIPCDGESAQFLRKDTQKHDKFYASDSHASPECNDNEIAEEENPF